jgi:hypothetical protein
VRRKGSLKEQGARDIVRYANHALSPTILRRRVGTRHTEVDSAREEKITDGALDARGWCYRTEWRPKRRSETGWEKCPISDEEERSTNSERNHRV